ncbi:unnamed protein product, partial [marine sediment metagenome]
LIDLGEAVWLTGFPPSRFHHLAIFLRRWFDKSVEKKQ